MFQCNVSQETALRNQDIEMEKMQIEIDDLNRNLGEALRFQQMVTCLLLKLLDCGLVDR